MSTTGERAVVGESGSVLWGASTDFDNKASCEALAAYLPSTLNPYVANVTAAAKLCSATLCQGKGRCVRKNPMSNIYLHLNPDHFHIQKRDGKYLAIGVPSPDDLNVFFTCQCYMSQECSANMSFSIPQTPIVIHGVWVMYLLLLMFFQYCWAGLSPSPLVPGFPFLFLWSAPTELCQSRFAIELDLSYFQLVSSTLKSSSNQSISIFYSDRFGIFPYVDKESGKHYYEGLPQLIDFQKQWKLAEKSIIFYIPENQPGLAVLDLEEWRPQWVRNWGSKDIYREKSIQVIMQSSPFLSYKEAQTLAVMTFEKAAKKYFLISLNLGKKLRPSRKWGYYLYPDCYNYDYNHDMENYTGKCPEIEKSRNDELLWLWKASTALFPSIYLEHVLQESNQGMLYVRHRIQEALRISMLPNKTHPIPVYAFIRPCFKDSEVNYLSEHDLVNTIGEAAALGASGVISWGNMNITSSEASCTAAKHHLEKVLNPYIVNVTTASQLCSEALCQANGRCVRKAWDSEGYLHLSPHRYHIYMDNTGRLLVKGHLSQEDVEWFEERFDCVCYTEESCFTPLTLKRFSSYADNEGVSLSQILLGPLLVLVLSAVWVATV